MRLKYVGNETEPNPLPIEGDLWYVGEVRDVDEGKGKRILGHVAFEETQEEPNETIAIPTPKRRGKRGE